MSTGYRVFIASALTLLVSGSASAAPLATWRVALHDGHGLVALGVLVLTGLSLVVFGSITRMRATDQIATKYVARAGAAAKDYNDGVAVAGPDWQAHSTAAEGSWEQGTQAAITDKRYMKGIDGKSAKYVNNATKLGSQRYPQGVSNAQGAYATGVQPYFDKLKAIASQLPPRGPRRSAQNQQRSNMVGVELGKLKVGH